MNVGEVGESARRLRKELSGQTLNPFINHTAEEPLSLYESFKLVLGVVIVPIRLSIFVAGLSLGWVFAKLSTVGISNEQLEKEPVTGIRRWLVMPIPWIVRGIMFACGFYSIRVKGKPAPASQAPLVTPNHISFFDALFFFYYLQCPVGVAKADVGKMPVVGPLMMSMQPILIHRGSREKKALAAQCIIERAQSRKWPHILIFPEGTVTNGRALISFKNGAFNPGVPVQPVVIRYPHVHCDVSWFANYMEVEFLPVHVPTEAERENPALFAANVRNEMAAALNVPCTEHSIVDVMLQIDASAKKLPSTSGVIQAEKLRALFGNAVDLPSLQAQLQKFAAVDTDGSGTVSYEEFCRALELPDHPQVREVFRLMDIDETGELDFREYAIGSAFVRKYLGNDETLRFAFNLFDGNQDGTIERSEFVAVMKHAFPNITDDATAKMWASADGDGDDLVNYEEFKEYMDAHPEYLSIVARFHYPSAETSDETKTE